MESLVPSEIARLVYGYLIEENCEAAAQLFLDSSACLKECLDLHKKGRKFNTSVLGLSLVDILNLYTDAVCLVKNYLEREESLNKALSEFVKELGNILVLDHDSARNIAKTFFLRISVPNKRRGLRNSEYLENIEEEEETEKVKEKENISEPKKNIQNEEPITKNNSADDFDLNMLQALLDNTALHERLAENINKAIDSSGETSSQKSDEKQIIETILHNTEADPIFHELLNELVGPRTEDTTTPEDTDKENGDPAEEKQTSGIETGETTNEVIDVETMKKFEEESNLAVEGILLAGNKKMQLEQSHDEFQPTETVLIATPQLVETSTGVFKQSFIIPAGYTVTDVIPASQLQSSSLQPVKATNLGSFGNLSPILPQQGTISRGASVRGFQPRRRRILPKSEGFIIQLPGQDDSIQEVQVEIPPPTKRLPEVMKRSRVRTRGGLQKIGSRGVKAIAPQVSNIDDNIEVVYSPTTLKNVNTSGINKKPSFGIKTRAMLKKQQKQTKDPVIVSSQPEVASIVEQQSSEVLSSAQQAEVLKEKDTVPITVPEDKKKDIEKEENEATPEQQNLVKKTRVSLSTPRRSHVRVLDFATPAKEFVVRKSLTSPKVYQHKRKEQSALDVIKRGMFNSPPKETSNEKVEVTKSKSKRDWDSDLRKFMAGGDGMDIPTSVGLKRKNGVKRCGNGKRKGVKSKLPKKIPQEKKTNEELVDHIEKEVRDVIGEEEMALNTSNNSELGNLIEQKLMEEMDKQDSPPTLETHEEVKTQIEPNINPSTPEENIMQKEISDSPNQNVEDKSSKPTENEKDNSVSNSNQDQSIGVFNTSTPLKLNMSPVNENSRGQLTPTTKLVMSQLGKSGNKFPSVFSPTSQSSLENILIKECSRMETEKAMSHLTQDIKKLDSPKSDTASCNVNSLSQDKTTDPKDTSSDHFNIGNKELNFESVCKNNICKNIFQTPAKLMSAPIPPGTPVEMTPLTRVLVSETSFASTVLVTPTLPPTPKNLPPLETPQKNDESMISRNNSSANESSKDPIAIVTNNSQQDSTNKESVTECLLEPSKDINECHTSPKITNNEQNKDNEISTKNVELNVSSSSSTDKNLCRTPKIKLCSPKASKSEKKMTEQRRSIEKNFSKQANVNKSDDEMDSEIDISNHSQQSDNNKNPKKTNTKQRQLETKKQTPPQKIKKLDGNNKSLKKSKSKLVVTKSKVDEEMEMQIHHLLKDTKAKLFGPDDSSDSDSAEAELKLKLAEAKSLHRTETKKSNVQLKSARERLQKLVNISMLNSTSTSDGSSEDESFEKQAVIEKVDKNHDDSEQCNLEGNNKRSVDTEHPNVESSMECNNSKNEEDNSKKPDGCGSNKFVENPKTILKDIEESCESFPTLHLSEESNQSLKSDHHLLKYTKSRKSPSGGHELLGKKNMLLQPSLKSDNEQIAIEDKVIQSKDHQLDTNNFMTDKTEIQSIPNTEPLMDRELHVNEQVYQINDVTEKFKSISESTEKTNQIRSREVTEYLDNYVYSFRLNTDKSGVFLGKELRTSPFLHVFELEKPVVVPERSNKEPSRTEHRSHIRSRSKNRKRLRSTSSSDDEKEKRDYGRGYNSHRSGRERNYKGHRKTYDHGRRESYSRQKHSSRNYDSRYRDYDHSPYDKKRSRHESPESRRSGNKREDRKPLDQKLHNSKYDKSHSYDRVESRVNDSFPSSKSGSEGDVRYADVNSTYSSDRTHESQKDRCSSSSQRLSIVVEEPFYMRPKLKSRKETSKLPEASEREDGELSDSSEVKRISPQSPEANKSLVLSLGAHDSRATLLKKVDLDHFLSIVHGNEE